jgi:hypothetical protein
MQEQEQELEVQEYAKRKYVRDSEKSNPWPLEALSSNSSIDDVFYPASEFSVMDSRGARVKPLPFPKYMLVSRNYYRKKWFDSYRRLKNVIVVMEWIPDTNKLQVSAEDMAALMADQEAKLAAAIRIFEDGDALTFDQSFEILRAVDTEMDIERLVCTISLAHLNPRFTCATMSDHMCVRARWGLNRYRPAILDVFAAHDKDGDKLLRASELRQAIQHLPFYKLEANRYAVALSLEEAEHLRAAMHMRSKAFGTASTVGLGLYAGEILQHVFPLL